MVTMTIPTTPAAEKTRTETTDEHDSALEPRPSGGGQLSGIRVRLLGSFVLLLALATAASVFVVRTLLVNRISERIDSDLVQEARELQSLAQGNDPETGEPFEGRVRRIFEVFFERNVPIENEALLSFVDGEAFLRSRPVAAYRLDRDPDLVQRWANLETSERGTVDTPVGPVEYLAVPVKAEGETRGVFVVAIFTELAQEEIEPAVAGAAGVGIAMLLIGTLLAWRTANQILRPVERLAETARGISESDLRGRIDVSGDDEIARLGRTFNEMLDRLEEAFKTQRRFVDDAGHELRTPITIIQGQLETVGDDPEDRRRTMEIVMDELDRMSRFVNDLLLLARAERPDFLALDTLDVAELTGDLFEKSRSLGAREWILDEVGRGRIVADRQRLTQAVIQLAENAVRHTNEGDAIRVGSLVSSGWASLWVADSGTGISLHEQDDIFNRFRRGGSGRRGSEGAGLGLSIVKAIVEAHRGRVDLESEPGEGARFTIIVPVDQPEAVTEGST